MSLILLFSTLLPSSPSKSVLLLSARIWNSVCAKDGESRKTRQRVWYISQRAQDHGMICICVSVNGRQAAAEGSDGMEARLRLGCRDDD